MPPDPFASDQDALNRPAPPPGITSNAYCAGCEVRWRAAGTAAEWPCWICGEDCKPITPPAQQVGITALGAAMAGCAGMGVLEAEAREWQEAWEAAFAGCFPTET